MHGEGDWVEARKIAQQGLARLADSVGGHRCYNLIQQIEAHSSHVSTERVWNQPLPTIDVRYRNVGTVHLRVVKFDFEDYVRSSRWGAEQLDENQRKALLAQQPVKAWSADLPATDRSATPRTAAIARARSDRPQCADRKRVPRRSCPPQFATPRPA